MPKLKKVRVREAKARDVGLFKKLWKGVLEQHVKDGSVVVATEQTLALYNRLFYAYVEGTLKGVVLFVADKGVLMWGDSGSPLEYPHKVIVMWGSYVESGSNEEIQKALTDRALELTKELGFEALVVQTYITSKKPEGFETFGTLHYKVLDDE